MIRYNNIFSAFISFVLFSVFIAFHKPLLFANAMLHCYLHTFSFIFLVLRLHFSFLFLNSSFFGLFYTPICSTWVIKIILLAPTTTVCHLLKSRVQIQLLSSNPGLYLSNDILLPRYLGRILAGSRRNTEM